MLVQFIPRRLTVLFRLHNFLRKCDYFSHFSLFSVPFSRSAVSLGSLKPRHHYSNFIKGQEASAPEQVVQKPPSDCVEETLYKVKKHLGDVERTPSQEELECLRRDLLAGGKFEPRSLDSEILGCCIKQKAFDFGQAYVNFLIKRSLLNPGSIKNAASLCHSASVESQEKFDVKVAERLYWNVKDLLQISSLFTSTSILLLCAINRWAEALNSLEEIDEKRGLKSCLNALAFCAFEADEETIGWKLLKGLKKVQNAFEVFTQKAVISFCYRKAKSGGASQSLFCMSRFLRLLDRLHVYPTLDIVGQIEQYFKMLGGLDDGINFDIVRTKVSSKTGQCSNCYLTLKPVFILEEEYGILQNAILEKVIKGADVYRNTSPEEVDTFLKFCDKPEKFDVVVDGLNVFYYGHSLSGAERINRLTETVECLKDSGKFKNVLVFARSHVVSKSKYTEAIFHRLKQIATVYLLERNTADDGFFLYAALKKGPRCWLLSNDRMSSEMSILGNETVDANILKRFLAKRQITHEGKIDRPIFHFPLKHEVIAQEERGGWRWHVPFDDGSDRYSYQYPNDWMCIKKSRADF